MRMRLSIASSLAAIFLLSGCSGVPDLLQCQAAAELGVDLHEYVQERRGDEASAGTLNEQLLVLATGYDELDVDGELAAATARLSNDLLDLHHHHRHSVPEGGTPDAAEEERLTTAAVRSFAEIQTLCDQAAG